MDIGRAFSYVFDDEEWVKKILIGGLISLIPLLGTFVVYGYMAEIARRAYQESGTEELPEWDDIGGYLTSGLFFWLGLALWALPFILLIACVAGAVILLGIATGVEEAIAVSFIVFYMALVPAIMFFALASALVIPVLLGRYAVHEHIGAMFEFSEIFAEIRRTGAVPLLLLVVTYLAAGYASQLGILLCFVGVIFTGFYGQLAVAHAAGQTYRLASGIQPLPAEAQRPIGY